MGLTPPDPDDSRVDVALRALAEPRRREILRLVIGQELAVGEIAAAFSVTRPAISQHLAVLREAGLVEQRQVGTRNLYSGRAEGLAEVRSYLDQMWSSALDVARQITETEAGTATHEERRSAG